MNNITLAAFVLSSAAIFADVASVAAINAANTDADDSATTEAVEQPATDTLKTALAASKTAPVVASDA